MFLLSEVNIPGELYTAFRPYLPEGRYFPTMESYNLNCPICEHPLRNKHQDSVANVESESVDVCDICDYSEHYAYGNCRVVFEGIPVSDEMEVGFFLLALLRKRILLDQEWTSLDQTFFKLLHEEGRMLKDDWRMLFQRMIAEAG